MIRKDGLPGNNQRDVTPRTLSKQMRRRIIKSAAVPLLMTTQPLRSQTVPSKDAQVMLPGHSPDADRQAASSYEEAIRRFTGTRVLISGRIKLNIAVLIDNGNTVPISIVVIPTPDSLSNIESIAVFSERNPQHEVILLTVEPGHSSTEVASRIRLATSQKLIAIANFEDNTCCSDEVDVIVTLAACLEGDG
jgi:sulfur-oxidizing protein SoxY